MSLAGRLPRAFVGLALLATLLVFPAEAASAHSILGPSGSTNYRSKLLMIDPAIGGVSAKVVDGGQHVELTNTNSMPVVILGYSGEDYLMVDSRGVWQNVRSPSLYLNRSSTPGLVYMPPGTDAHAPPSWEPVCSCDVAVWHDHRVHWGSSTPPPDVAKSPGRYHLVRDWEIDARSGQTSVRLTGQLTWVPGPSPLPWAVAGAAAAVLGGAIGFARRWRFAIAGGLLALVALDSTRAAGLVLGRYGSFGLELHALSYDGVLMLLFWMGALLAAAFALRGRVGVAYAAAAISAIIGLTDAVPSLSALSDSQVVTAYPSSLERFLVATTLGVAAGLFVASFVLIRRLERSNPVATPFESAESSLSAGVENTV